MDRMSHRDGRSSCSSSTLSVGIVISPASYRRLFSRICEGSIGRNGGNADAPAAENMFPKFEDVPMSTYLIVFEKIRPLHHLVGEDAEVLLQHDDVGGVLRDVDRDRTAGICSTSVRYLVSVPLWTRSTRLGDLNMTPGTVAESRWSARVRPPLLGQALMDSLGDPMCRSRLSALFRRPGVSNRGPWTDRIGPGRFLSDRTMVSPCTEGANAMTKRPFRWIGWIERGRRETLGRTHAWSAA